WRDGTHNRSVLWNDYNRVGRFFQALFRIAESLADTTKIVRFLSHFCPIDAHRPSGYNKSNQVRDPAAVCELGGPHRISEGELL
ncbi:hypothetical protein, partial [Gemmiger sp.]|uniref:hypothetical protein n=1 Tax=Gemmiger sp. TaxID=2049027 RepID=UPI003AB7C703